MLWFTNMLVYLVPDDEPRVDDEVATRPPTGGPGLSLAGRHAALPLHDAALQQLLLQRDAAQLRAGAILSHRGDEARPQASLEGNTSSPERQAAGADHKPETSPVTAP